MQIVQAVPQAMVLSILAGIHQRHNRGHRPLPPAPLHLTACLASTDYVTRLLLLLPREFHPAVVFTCCMPSPDTLSCVLSADYTFFVSPNCPRHNGLSRGGCYGSRSRADPATARECTCATATFQLLAAAAPLAGGSMDAAWSLCDLGLSAYDEGASDPFNVKQLLAAY